MKASAGLNILALTEVIKSVLGRPQGFTEKKYLPRDHKNVKSGLLLINPYNGMMILGLFLLEK